MCPGMIALLVLLLLGSGFSALIYQVIWVRLLGLVFGVTVYAASAVLAAFMGGLALGSYLAGRLSDRVRSPLRWFAAAETLIGLSALATPTLLAWLTPLYRQISAARADDTGALTLARLACSAAILLVPTTMMGAIVPFVLRRAISGSRDVARRAALLYAANTAGALTGTLAAGYVLISSVGLTRTMRLAAAVNLGVAAVAFLAAGRRFSPSNGGTAIDEANRNDLQTATPETPSLTPAVRRTVLVVFGISGFVSLALEIVWIRALLMFLPATTYVFTIILATVLGGIATGSAIAAALRRRVPSLRALAAIEAAIALSALLSMWALATTYAAGWRTSAALQPIALSILPTTIFMGLAFPLGLHYWSLGAARVGARVGAFYALNVAGAVAGALAAGFVLIPWLGARGSLVALAGITLGCALSLYAAAGRSPVALTVRAATLIVLFVIAAWAVPDPLATALERRYRGEQVLWREEGVQSTVSVHRGEDGRRILYLDGLHQANDQPGMLATHRAIGTLAMALHPEPRDALVVGLGGGATAGAVARFSDARITIVELSPGVVRAAPWFAHATGNVLQQPHVRLRVADGRNHLLLTNERYDVITADIIQPFHAGAGSLYSAEYFRLARAALRDDGLMLQWIGHRPRSQYLLIARTFLEVFPHATAWNGGTLLAGTVRPLKLEVERYRERLRDPRFGSALGSVGIAGWGGLVRTYTAGPDELRAFVGPGPILTDDRPLVEYFMSLPKNEPDIDLSTLHGDVRRHIVE
jgi:spermidine synthase